MSKTLTRYGITGLMAISMIASALFIGNTASAALGTAGQPLEADQFFGSSATGEDFAGEVGLSSGDLTTTIAAIIRVALGFLGVVAVVIILFGGFKWMTSGGNETKVKDAQKLIIAGVIGLVIILSAYAIAQFVIGSITAAVAP